MYILEKGGGMIYRNCTILQLLCNSKIILKRLLKAQLAYYVYVFLDTWRQY